MWKYSVLLSYLGTSFCGWQKQKSAQVKGLLAVQSEIEKAIQRITGEEVSVVGSGRTDSGVHAIGQVAHFVLKRKEWDPAILFKALNGLLATQIQIIAIQSVSIEFHAQRSAVKKQYSYYFQQGRTMIPSFEPLSWWIKKRLDLKAMNQGLSYLVGENDFKPFQSSGSKPGPTVRTILEADVTYHSAESSFGIPMGGFLPQHETGFVRVRVMGTGFLKQMVRGIAGTLLQVGEGRRPPECFQEIMKKQDRGLVGPTAPARALWLERVWYPESFGLWG